MKEKPLKIAIVVHGRFHAFDLARELIKLGHNVFLFTNYPKWAVAQFEFPKDRVRSFWLHGILVRVMGWAHKTFGLTYSEAWLHTMFGKWVAQVVNKEEWDVVHAWSGVSEEIRRHPMASQSRRLKLLMRGSAHIRMQAELLEQEEKRAGVPIDRPSQWMIEREKREYRLADFILVLSNFAFRSFCDLGVSKKKLALLPLGAELARFRPDPEVIERRCQRILSQEPLRVLMVGTFSFQKGALDFLKISEQAGLLFPFRFVGEVLKETKDLIGQTKHSIDFVHKQPQSRLPLHYAWADIFVFPTIQDGYAVVLAQALASGLPVLATTNCSWPDMAVEGKNGWVLPIRSPEAFVERLRWCHTHRPEFAKMVRDTYQHYKPRDWSNVAEDFISICRKLIKERQKEQ